MFTPPQPSPYKWEGARKHSCQLKVIFQQSISKFKTSWCHSVRFALIPQPLLPILGEGEPEKGAGDESLVSCALSQIWERAGVRVSQCCIPPEFLNLELLGGARKAHSFIRGLAGKDLSSN